MKLRKNDIVIITVGKDRGRQGKISQIVRSSKKIVVEGANKYKRHVKPRDKNQTGQIIDRERPLPVANVALLCPKCKQPTRIGYKITRDNKKVRVCRKCREEID